MLLFMSLLCIINRVMITLFRSGYFISPLWGALIQIGLQQFFVFKINADTYAIIVF